MMTFNLLDDYIAESRDTTNSTSTTLSMDSRDKERPFLERVHRQKKRERSESRRLDYLLSSKYLRFLNNTPFFLLFSFFSLSFLFLRSLGPLVQNGSHYSPNPTSTQRRISPFATRLWHPSKSHSVPWNVSIGSMVYSVSRAFRWGAPQRPILRRYSCFI